MSFLSKVGSAIGGTGGLLGGVGHWLNDATGVSNSMNQQYKYNQSAADADMARSIYLWNMQNEYNTPAAQIARMAAAGIDVNPMTYAVGNGNMSTTASSISAPGTGSVSGGSSGINPFAMVMNLLSGIKGLKQADATVEQTIQNTENSRKLTEADVKLKDEQRKAAMVNREIAEKDNEFYNRFGYHPNNSQVGNRIFGFLDNVKRVADRELNDEYDNYLKRAKEMHFSPVSFEIFKNHKRRLF